MTGLLIVIVVLLALALLVASAALAQRMRSTSVSRRLLSRVLVTTKSGAAFDGVLFAADGTAWVLRNAKALGAGDREETVPVDGEVLILTADIQFAQRP